MLQPKKIKFKKNKKGTLKRKNNSFFLLNSLKDGTTELKSLQTARITAKQLEVSKQKIGKKVKKNGNLLIKAFPEISVSAKPAETRMGKGKGAFSFWGCKVKQGVTIFEVSGATLQKIPFLALRSIIPKLPIKTKIKKA